MSQPASKMKWYADIGHRDVAHQMVILIHDGNARHAVLAHPFQGVKD